jgi:hypothetical protein
MVGIAPMGCEEVYDARDSARRGNPSTESENNEYPTQG